MLGKSLIILVLLLAGGLGSSIVIPKFYLFRSTYQQELMELRAENEALRSQVVAQSELRRQPEGRLLRAVIYSTYPFSNRQEITIAAGRRDGLIEGMPVTVGKNFLLGQVRQIFDNYSVVQTIFDRNWQFPVRLGDGAAEALLIGGQEPSVSMVDKKYQLRNGLEVYAAGAGFPYGLMIGKAKGVRDLQVDVWQEAGLALPYNFNELREVGVLLDYERK